MSEKIRARSPVAPGDVVGGKYRVDRVLGAGGMGVVVAATHVELGQAVALKFVLPEALSGQDAVERFMREARAAVRLKSEHVCRVYDVGRDREDRPYMVLEILDGLDLAKLNKQRGPLPVADAVEYVLQACEALIEAHAAGIIHRDLKPQNLFVTRRLNGAPLVKVLDFGIAKAIGPAAIGQMALTDSAAVIGSPLYMAPEQMRSARTADTRSDIWALGVILYELLGGQLPFYGETVTEVCIRVVNEEPKPLVALRPGLEPALVAVVMRCLAKAPDARWQNVAQLASSLEPFSRSAQQGGPVRPWRSFEDTQDSHERPKVSTFADDTGPSTAVTMPSALAPQGAAIPDDSAGKKLVSTDVAWGKGDSGARSVERPRSFAKGLAAGVVVSIAAAAVAAGIFVRASTSSQAPAHAAPPPSVETAPPPPPPPPAREEPSATTPSPPPTAVETTAPPATNAVKHGRAPLRATTAPKTTATAAAPSASPPPVAPAPTSAPTIAPNGAPILR